MVKGKGAVTMSKNEQNEANRGQFLGVKQAARFLGVSESLVWSEAKKGNLYALRLGDRILFNRTYLESLGTLEVSRG
jgi:excisionase family DNA binding protein